MTYSIQRTRAKDATVLAQDVAAGRCDLHVKWKLERTAKEV
jgi:hypothetical protein